MRKMSGKNVSLKDTENPGHFIEAQETGNIPVISTRQEEQSINQIRFVEMLKLQS